MDIQDSLIQAASCASVAILLYKTDSVFEYGKLMRLISFSEDIQYKCFKIQNNGKTNYFDYLNFKHNNFFTKMLSCPYCFGFWLCLIVSKIYLALFVYFVYVVLYKLIELLFSHGIRN